MFCTHQAKPVLIFFKKIAEACLNGRKTLSPIIVCDLSDTILLRKPVAVSMTIRCKSSSRCTPLQTPAPKETMGDDNNDKQPCVNVPEMSSGSRELASLRLTSEAASGSQQALQDDTEHLSKLADFSFSSSDSEPDDFDTRNGTDYDRLKKKNEENIQMWKEICKKGVKKMPYPKQKIIRNRNLTDASVVFQCNAWDDVEWDDEQKKQAMEMASTNQKTKMDSERIEKLENEADRFWDEFYKNHKNKFFRDRNWLFSEFPELESPYGSSVSSETACEQLAELRLNESFPGENSKFKVLEVGCGVGNTVFPLLSSNNNPHTYVYCCDFSPQAVELVQQEATFEAARCTPFVLDITDENPTTPFPDGSIDVLTAIFVVSAITPSKFQQVMRNFHRMLKPGGLVLFRDYGRYDLAQLRFKDGRCIQENFYVRGDGTRVYFFTEEEVETLFKNERFVKESLIVDRRLQVNRGKQLKMFRVWIQGKFRKL